MTRGVLGRKGLSSFEIGGTSSNEVEETNKKLLTCGDRNSFAQLTENNQEVRILGCLDMIPTSPNKTSDFSFFLIFIPLSPSPAKVQKFAEF